MDEETKAVKVIREHPPVVIDHFLAILLTAGVSLVILALIVGLIIVALR